MSDGSGLKGLFAAFAGSHPRKDKRIERLQSCGATYRTVYGAH